MDINAERIAQVRNSDTKFFYDAPATWKNGMINGVGPSGNGLNIFDYHDWSGKNPDILSSNNFELPAGSLYPAYMDEQNSMSHMFGPLEATPHTFR